MTPPKDAPVHTTGSTAIQNPALTDEIARYLSGPTDTKGPIRVAQAGPPKLESKPKPGFSTDLSAQPLSIEDWLNQRKGGGIDAKNLNSGAAPSRYPEPRPDQDERVLRPVLEAIKFNIRTYNVKFTTSASVLYDLFLKTSNDRSGENKVPDSITISELHKGMKDRVKSIQLAGDSDLLKEDMHGIVLHPTGRNNPGTAYAVLRDENGIPVNVIEYYLGNGKPQYIEQWIFEREMDKDTGGQKTNIYQFRESSQTNIGRPKEQNGTMVDAFVGRTEYLSDSGGGPVKASQYNNLDQPTVVIDLNKETMQLRDPNSGRMIPSPQLRDPNSGRIIFPKAYTSKLAFSSAYLR